MAATLTGVDPALVAAFNAMVAESPYALGISSGFRSREEQQRLYDAYLAGKGNLAAKPGSSNHESGFAIDIDYPDKDRAGAAAWVRANAARFGLVLPVRGEDWHLELAGGKGKRAGAGLDKDAMRFNLVDGAQQNPEDVLAARIESVMGMLTGASPSADTPADVLAAQPGTDVTVLNAAPEGQAKAQGAVAPDDVLGNARIIAQVGRQMGAPDQAIKIALAASLVESNLRNVRHGDRDSLGLFQQRPSQGWGTPDQVMDPAYAATQFFSRLLKLNWQGMDPGAAAQAVQRSAFPDRYGKRMGEAQSIFSQLGAF
jgi:hypothetical protein